MKNIERVKYLMEEKRRMGNNKGAYATLIATAALKGKKSDENGTKMKHTSEGGVRYQCKD